jgi:replicative DNA helicase
MIDKRALKDKIDNGKLGKNKGLPHGFDRLVEYLPGIQQSTYYLCGAESSVGKSAFINNSFVFNPIDWYLANKNKTDVKLKIHYYSFEISKEMMLYKAVCRKIWLDKGILLDINYILSRGKYRISEEHYKLVIETLDYFDEMGDLLSISDIPQNPTGIWHDQLKFAKENGKGLTEDYRLEGDYTPNNSNLYNLVVIDHISLVKKERGFNTKDLIDKLSEYLIILRNKCNFTPVVVQQLNRAGNDPVRLKTGKMEPMLSDFKDSGNTIADCNVCMSLFSPARYEMEEHRNYIIDPSKNGLGGRYRNLQILKNRDGEADKTIGLQFIGEVGHFSELPKASDMKESNYSKIKQIKKDF